MKFNDGNYLVCNYSGNAAGLGYVNSQSGVTYPYALTTGYNGAFFFSTTQSNDSGQTGQVLYFKSEENRFKIGGSGSSVGVHLYLKEGTPEHIKQDRGLSFNPASVTCILGETPQKPVLSGTYTTVTYSSSDSKIATVSANGTVTPVAAGTVTITASVAEDEQYSAGSATYTLQIRRASTAGTYVRVTSTDQIKDGGEYVIAADAGAEHLSRACITPDEAVGDFDAAQRRRAELSASTGYAIQVVFDAPFYKLRGGGWTTKKAAEDKARELSAYNINAFVVKVK